MTGQQAVTEVRGQADADAASGAATGNRGPPSLLVRVASAFMYIVPWIDILGLGREVYHFFHNALLLYLLPGARCAAPSAPIQRQQAYYTSAEHDGTEVTVMGLSQRCGGVSGLHMHYHACTKGHQDAHGACRACRRAAGIIVCSQDAWLLYVCIS